MPWHQNEWKCCNCQAPLADMYMEPEPRGKTLRLLNAAHNFTAILDRCPTLYKWTTIVCKQCGCVQQPGAVER